MDGTEGASARLARAFAPRLEEALGVPVELFDERLSTFEAQARLRDQGFAAREQKDKIDAEAAAVILQGWLDGRRRVRKALRALGDCLAARVLAAGGASPRRAGARSRGSATTASARPRRRSIDVPPGASARQVVRLLARGGALADEQLAWRYVRFLEARPAADARGRVRLRGRR